MSLYEEVSRAEFDDILAGQAELDGSGGGEGSDEASAPADEKDEETEEKPKGRSRAKADREEEPEGDDEGEEDGSEEGGQQDGDWFSTGYSESNKITDAEAGGYDDKAWRFFLRAGEETEIVFLDDGESDIKRWNRLVAAPFNVWEHNFAVVNPDDPDDVTFYDLTCVRGKLQKDGKPRRCYVCERKKKIKRRFRSMYTVLAKYEGKKGEAWSKKLLPADKAALKKIKRHAKKHGMFGMVFNIFRTEERASRIGDDWSYDRTMSEEEVQELLGERTDLAPLDYIEECRPMSWDELEQLLKDAIISDPKKKKGRGKRSGRGRSDDDDDRPRGRGRDRDDQDDDRRDRRRDREDDEDRPKRRGRDEEETSEDRPRRRGSREEDAEERPRRRGRSEESEEQNESSDDTEEGSDEKEPELADAPTRSERTRGQKESQAAADDAEDIPF